MQTRKRPEPTGRGLFAPGRSVNAGGPGQADLARRHGYFATTSVTSPRRSSRTGSIRGRVSAKRRAWPGR